MPECFGIRFHVDHIISLKHGGSEELENLAYACPFCNVNKGADIAALSYSGELMSLFHPRLDVWEDYFRMNGAVIEPLSPRGEAKARLLRFNHALRVNERQELIALGAYPLS